MRSARNILHAAILLLLAVAIALIVWIVWHDVR